MALIKTLKRLLGDKIGFDITQEATLIALKRPEIVIATVNNQLCCFF